MFQNKKDKERIRELENDLVETDHKRRELKTSNDKLSITNAGLTRQRDELRSKVREQTQADAYFSCIKIMKEIEKDEPNKEKLAREIRERDERYNQLQGLQQQRLYPYPPTTQFGVPIGNPFGWWR